jgi:prepilin peptidase dependent protein B
MMRTRGFSLVELMMGVALGLVLVAGALGAWAHHTRQTRHILAQAQVAHELRTALQLMAQNLRQAQHWRDADQGVAGPANISVWPNPHDLQVLPQEIWWDFSPSDTAASEHLAYRLHAGALQIKLGVSPWQDLSDVQTVRMTHLSFSPQSTIQALPQLCTQPCLGTEPEQTCPLHQERRFLSLSLTAQAVHDSQVKQTLQTTVALRNHLLKGRCP